MEQKHVSPGTGLGDSMETNCSHSIKLLVSSKYAWICTKTQLLLPRMCWFKTQHLPLTPAHHNGLTAAQNKPLTASFLQEDKCEDPLPAITSSHSHCRASQLHPCVWHLPMAPHTAPPQRSCWPPPLTLGWVPGCSATRCRASWANKANFGSTRPSFKEERFRFHPLLTALMLRASDMSLLDMDTDIP